MQWKNEAMDKLRRYGAMRCAMENIPAEIRRLRADATALRSSSADTVHVRGGGSRREEALINNLVERQELTHSLRQVQRWIQTVDQGLEALSDDDRLILQRLYLTPERGAVDRLCEELGLEQSSVYRKRDQALQRFTIAMYGFTET
jgi:hypothetical protein